jgi:hypothetical protein
MRPSELNSSLLRRHFVSAQEGTNNLLFYFATIAPIQDSKTLLSQEIVLSLGLPTEIQNFYDYRSRFPGIYNRLYQFCVISLCSDIEKLFRDLFSERRYIPRNGRGFYQRFNDVISALQTHGYDFSPITDECNKLRLAFQIRHICAHNLGEVDQAFIDATAYPGTIGDVYQLDETAYREMYEAYTTLLKAIDDHLGSTP